MSRFGAKTKRLPGAEFTWETGPAGEADTAPTPLYPVCCLPSRTSVRFLCCIAAIMSTYSRQLRRPQAYVVPFARHVTDAEQREVDHYRRLRERFHEGPYYSVLDASASTAKKGSAARANFDPFTGMPSYSGRYQKKRRTLPRIAGAGREYGKLI